MARFRGTVQGARGEASRLGTAATGVTSTADGWHIGGEVEISDDDRGGDVVDFTLSGGSNARNSPRMVARYVEGDNAPTIYPAAFTWKEVGPIDDPAAVLRTEFRFGDAAVRVTAYDARSNAARTLNTFARTMIAGRDYLFTMTAKETT